MPSMGDDDDQRFWQLLEVLRSDSPHAFAARGSEAARITRPHPIDVPHGLGSPGGCIYELDGQVLLLFSECPFYGPRKRHALLLPDFAPLFLSGQKPGMA